MVYFNIHEPCILEFYQKTQEEFIAQEKIEKSQLELWDLWLDRNGTQYRLPENVLNAWNAQIDTYSNTKSFYDVRSLIYHDILDLSTESEFRQCMWLFRHLFFYAILLQVALDKRFKPYESGINDLFNYEIQINGSTKVTSDIDVSIQYNGPMQTCKISDVIFSLEQKYLKYNIICLQFHIEFFDTYFTTKTLGVVPSEKTRTRSVQSSVVCQYTVEKYLLSKNTFSTFRYKIGIIPYAIASMIKNVYNVVLFYAYSDNNLTRKIFNQKHLLLKNMFQLMAEEQKTRPREINPKTQSASMFSNSGVINNVNLKTLDISISYVLNDPMLPKFEILQMDNVDGKVVLTQLYERIESFFKQFFFHKFTLSLSLNDKRYLQTTLESIKRDILLINRYEYQAQCDKYKECLKMVEQKISDLYSQYKKNNVNVSTNFVLDWQTVLDISKAQLLREEGYICVPTILHVVHILQQQKTKNEPFSFLDKHDYLMSCFEQVGFLFAYKLYKKLNIISTKEYNRKILKYRDRIDSGFNYINDFKIINRLRSYVTTTFPPISESVKIIDNNTGGKLSRRIFKGRKSRRRRRHQPRRKTLSSQA